MSESMEMCIRDSWSSINGWLTDKLNQKRNALDLLKQQMAADLRSLNEESMQADVYKRQVYTFSESSHLVQEDKAKLLKMVLESHGRRTFRL